MHPPDVKAEALRLVAEGLNDCEVSRRTGIARSTIRDWRQPRHTANPIATCPRCWLPLRPIRFGIDYYAELLGAYLGDGCISDGPRTTRLRIACDPKYPGLLDHYEALLRRMFCGNKVGRVVSGPGGFGGSCTHLYVYHRHLGCLFPQHARGRKHERRISLEDWQLAVVLTAPWAFLRGCFHTDGCRFVNRTGPYEYPSYHFGNRSGDIARLVHLVCSRVSVQSRLTHWERRDVWSVRINHRTDVARMDRHIGPKR